MLSLLLQAFIFTTFPPTITPVTMKLTGSDAKSLDNRPLVKDLIEKHSKVIEGVREVIQKDKECFELYNKGDNQKRYDDIWILRFVLSHKGSVKSASKAALKTIKFREEKKLNELGDIRHRITNLGVANETTIEPLPGAEVFERYCGENTNLMTQPDRNRGIVLYCDVGQIDQTGLAENISEEEMTETILYANEAVHQVVDDVTRRTGLLTKQLKIIDMGNVYLRQMDRAYLKRDAASSKKLEDYYPQLLGAMYIYNSPTWVSVLWSALRPFFPKRVAEKVDILPSLTKILKSKETHLKCVFGFVSEENLPERFGGKNKEWPLPAAGLQYGPQSSQ